MGKVLYLVQEFFLLHPSGRWICISQPTDLDIITSEREITLVEQLALLAICCTSAHFMAVGLWARDSVHSSPLSRQKTYLSIHPSSRSGYLNLISFFTKNIDDVSLSAS